MGGQPKLADNKASTAMDALLSAADPAAAPVHAVVTTEQQLFQRAASLPDAKNTVASWLPPGPTAMADYPTVLLSGNWLSQEQVSAASEFARFMRKPEQLAELAKAGFRTEGGTPPKSDVTSFAPVSAPLSVGDNAMRATLANALTAPVESPAVTIMLDQSMPTDEGGKSRLANVVAALNARLQALPPNSAVGLWTFDGVEGRSEVSTGPLSDPVNGQPRSAALTECAGLADRIGRRCGVVHHAADDLRPDQGELPPGPEQFDSGHHRRGRTPTNRSTAQGLQAVHPRGVRPGPPDRGQRHRLRLRFRPRHLGGRRTGQRRQLPEPGQLGGPRADDRRSPQFLG